MGNGLDFLKNFIALSIFPACKADSKALNNFSCCAASFNPLARKSFCVWYKLLVILFRGSSDAGDLKYPSGSDVPRGGTL